MCSEPTISCCPDYKSFKFGDENEGMKDSKVDNKSSLEEFCESHLKRQDSEVVSNPLPEEKRNGNVERNLLGATEDKVDGDNHIGEPTCTKNGSDESRTRKSRCVKKGPMDYELPELVVFLQESSYHFVKDICVDKKVNSHGKCMVENCALDHKIISCILESDSHSRRETRAQNVVMVPSISKESKNADHDKVDNSNKNDGRKQHGITNSVTEGLDVDGVDKISIDKSTKQIVPEPLLLVGEIQKSVLTSSMVPSTVEKKDDHRKINDNITIPKEAEKRKNSFDSDLSMSTSGTEELSLSPDNHQQDPDTGKMHESPEDRLVPQSPTGLTSHIHQNCSDESSLFASGHFSGLISHHGSATPSFRSISHRSNSSTTSSRSFAFPILASEWHGSPEKMVKPDKRQLKKSEGKCARFLCCKF